MPHLVIEYSEGALDRTEVEQMMIELASKASNSGVMKAEDIKVRARAYDDFIVAGKRDSFVHLSVYLLSGRTPDQKVLLSTQLRESMERLCPDVTSLSVDVRDMDPVSYKKRLKGSPG